MLQSKFWRDFFTCTGGKLATSEGYTCFFVVFVCYNRNRGLLTSDLLPSISLAVGQSSMNISLEARLLYSLTTERQPVVYWDRFLIARELNTLL